MDALAAEEPATIDAARLDRVRRLATASNRLAAALTREVRAAENHQSAEFDGLKSMRSWLRTHARIPNRAARRLIETGRPLEHLPAAERAFAAGTVSADAVAAIAPRAHLPPRRRPDPDPPPPARPLKVSFGRPTPAARDRPP